jgi:hypothetical protein
MPSQLKAAVDIPILDFSEIWSLLGLVSVIIIKFYLPASVNFRGIGQLNK